MAGGRVRRLRGIAELAFRRMMPGRHWRKLPKAQQMQFELMRRFLGVPAEEMRVMFASKGPAEIMGEMHRAAAELPPDQFAQRIHAFATTASFARMEPANVLNFFMSMRNALAEAQAQEHLDMLQQAHKMWAEREQARSERPLAISQMRKAA